MKHHYSKKGDLTMGELIMIIIAGVVFTILVLIFFIGPDSMMETVKKMLPKANTYIKKPLTTDERIEKQLTNDEASKEFTKLMLHIRQLQEGMKNEKGEEITKACFLFIETPADYASLFSQYHITVEDTGSSTAFTLEYTFEKAEKESNANTNTLVAHDEFAGLKPCLVKGAAAETFYKQWIDPDEIYTYISRPISWDKWSNPDTTIVMSNPPIDYLYVQSFALYEEEIQESLDNKHDWKTRGGKYVLYLHDNHLCFFPTTSDASWFGHDCELLSDNGNSYLDDDCFFIDENTGKIALEKHHPYVYNENKVMCTN